MQTNGNRWLEARYELVYVDASGKVLAEVSKDHCNAHELGQEDFVIYEYNSILHYRGNFRTISKETIKKEVEKDFG